MKKLVPQLSMKLECFDRRLFLPVEDTGIYHAFDISIVLNKIENNGDFNVDKPILLFSNCLSWCKLQK